MIYENTKIRLVGKRPKHTPMVYNNYDIMDTQTFRKLFIVILYL